jgi:hypothetical protein
VRVIDRGFLSCALIVVAVTGGVATAAEAGVTRLPDVTRVLHGPVNSEQAFRVEHCIIHYEFGTYDGVAYAKARSTHEDRGYSCTVSSQVSAVRFGDEIVTGPPSVFTCGAPSPRKPCLPQVYRRWAQSSLPSATGFAALFHVNVSRSWPPPTTWRKDFITVSAF